MPRAFKQPRKTGKVEIVSWLSDPEIRDTTEKKRQGALGRFHANRRLLPVPKSHAFHEAAEVLDVVWDGSGTVGNDVLLKAIEREVSVLLESEV